MKKPIKFIFISLFTEQMKPFFNYSIIKKPIEQGDLIIQFIDLRDFGIGKQKQVDDFQYGPGRGMVLMVEPIFKALQFAKKAAIGNSLSILLSPQGETWKQTKISPLLQKYSTFIFISGNYEGFDERVRKFVDLEFSIGDYVLSGGELPALVIANSLIRMLPDTIQSQSRLEDSFTNGRLDYAVYTKPLRFKDLEVPSILLSGHHEAIREWREKNALLKTFMRRKDLFKIAPPSAKEMDWLEEFTKTTNKKS